MQGHLHSRLPAAADGDEIDRIAHAVNLMLDEIERLLDQLKSVGDNIAHDLRTPLTGCAPLLYRMQQQLGDSPHRAMMGQVIAEVDSLLLRFRALLRISEIENKQRRAGFKLIQLPEILAQAVNFLEPLAENKSIKLSMVAESVDPINGDGELLFEVFVNVLDNAIKFTPEGGRVKVHLSSGPKGAQVDIVDSGAGIREERKIGSAEPLLPRRERPAGTRLWLGVEHRHGDHPAARFRVPAGGCRSGYPCRQSIVGPKVCNPSRVCLFQARQYLINLFL